MYSWDRYISITFMKYGPKIYCKVVVKEDSSCVFKTNTSRLILVLLIIELGIFIALIILIGLELFVVYKYIIRGIVSHDIPL